jgi:dephospho-CoA kinase
MKIFGLTGGIASGKSTISKHWANLGIPIVNADKLSREVVAPGSPALENIREVFGSRFISDSGMLRRKELGHYVFSNPEALEKLNTITHPEITKLAQKKFDDLRDEGHKLVCYESPLLFECNEHKIYNPVVLVYCSIRTQIKRIMQRDMLTIEEAFNRISAQMPLEDKFVKASYRIKNDDANESAILAASEDVLNHIRLVYK